MTQGQEPIRRRAYADEWAETVQSYYDDFDAEVATWPKCPMCDAPMCPDFDIVTCEICRYEPPIRAANKAHDIA